MNELEFIAKGQDGLYYDICEGTGDNLLQEDIDEGYVDYIYYNVYKSLIDLKENNECDGGMYLLKKLYADHTQEEIISIMEEYVGTKLEVL